MGLSLQPGSLISHYRVISPLGAGGMGEVYMARDETLDRTVALKILPPHVVRNEERLRRFVQEARSASSLSHPHIVTIYEIGQAEVRPGKAADDTVTASPPGAGVSPAAGPPGAPAIHFIAMELVSGQTLRHLIHLEKTDTRTLLRHLAQAAEGLAKAHAAGIVHRDLKPENIMVSKDGYAKILDFGLAKLVERQSPEEGVTSAPTAAGHPTGEGVVMGTVGYMSPEQVQAKGIDHRSDIFSFGCILYEAATRRRPFTADSDVETMHKILHDKPPSVDELNPEAPAELRRLIRRCLAKSPDQRLQSMKDLALELNEIVEEFDSLSVSSDSRTSSSGVSGALAAPAGASGVIRRWGAAAVVVVGLAGIGFGVWTVLHPPGGGAAQSSFQTMKMTRLASIEGLEDSSLSPDGRYLASVIRKGGKSSLWVRQVATGSDIQILPPQETQARGVTFSPDGNYLYYRSVDPENRFYNALFQVPTLGGTPRKIIFDVDSGVTFSPDGRQLAFVRGYPQDNESALVVANSDGSGERKLAVTKFPNFFPTLRPAWSPHGGGIAAIAVGFEGGSHADLVEVAISDGKEKPIGAKRWQEIDSVAWLPDGSGLALVGTDIGESVAQVWFVSYPDGSARRISNDLNQYTGISVAADSKTLATVQRRRVANLWVAAAADPAAATQITFASEGADAISAVRATPAGSIVFEAEQEGSPHIWSIRPDGSGRTRLTPDGARSIRPVVARGTGSIVFTSSRADRVMHIWKMDADGGNLTQITLGGGEFAGAVSPDGRLVIFFRLDDPGLWQMPLAGGSPTKISEMMVGPPLYSPDGRLILHWVFKEEGGRIQLKLQLIPSEGGPPVRTMDLPRGFEFFRPALRWLPSGDALTYVRDVDGVFNIWSQPLEGGEPRAITDFKSGQIFDFDWSTDGKQLYLSRGSVSTDVVLITDFR